MELSVEVCLILGGLSLIFWLVLYWHVVIRKQSERLTTDQEPARDLAGIFVSKEN